MRYHAFDLLYLDGYDLRRVSLEDRKRVLSDALVESTIVKFSEDFPDGMQLYAAAQQQNLEGIVAKRRKSCYVEKRSREWLKIKLTQTQECVIGGYTDPRGSREHFGSIVLGLYDEKGRLLHVGRLSIRGQEDKNRENGAECAHGKSPVRRRSHELFQRLQTGPQGGPVDLQAVGSEVDSTFGRAGTLSCRSSFSL